MTGMYEQRLMSIGYPFTDAFNICRSFRRDRLDLDKFVKSEEQKAKEAFQCMV